MSGIYIHIPFCRQACIYCNFYFKTGTAQAEALVEAICHEIELRYIEWSEPVETIYFGGGTPSHIPAHIIERIIKTIQRNFKTDKIVELTLEANPDDISSDNLKLWKSAGVNRLSIGVQSFFDDDLKWMNRAHNAGEAANSIALALAEGFEVSIDLIFGVPGSSGEKWAKNLEMANHSGVHHLSCYGLTLEDNTAWKKLIDRKKYAAPDEGLTSGQFEMTMKYLEDNGWDHYEISNYCRPGYEAKHNSSYWQHKHYIGLGPSAHSFNGSHRKWNISDNLAYIKAIEANELPAEMEELTPENKVNEYLMTGLRTKWGVDIEKLKEMGFYNRPFEDKMNDYIVKGLVKKKESLLILTEQGKLYADGIAADLFF